MRVTPFHLAIIAQQPEIVHLIMKSVIQFSNTPVESIMKLLQKKTKIFFAKDQSPEIYFKDDRSLDGNNSFHLAARFHGKSLLTIVKFLRNEDLLDSVMDLLDVSDPHMGKKPLHMAARSPSSLPLSILLLCGVSVEAKVELISKMTS